MATVGHAACRSDLIQTTVKHGHTTITDLFFAARIPGHVQPVGRLRKACLQPKANTYTQTHTSARISTFGRALQAEGWPNAFIIIIIIKRRSGIDPIPPTVIDRD